MTDVVTQPAGNIALPFTAIELTQAINNLPPPFGQFTAEGAFPVEPLVSQYVEIDIENGVISALPVTGSGPATLSAHEKSEARIFKIPQIEHQDIIKAADIRSWLTIAGRSKSPTTLVDLMNKRLMRFNTKFNLTRELMMTSSMKGVIIDGAGNEIYNLFNAFEIAPKVVYFNFADADFDVQSACNLVFQLITQDLSDEVMTEVRAKVSTSFFNALTTHPKVIQFWLQAEQALALANMVRNVDGGYRPREFVFGNIRFVEYSAVVPMWGGGSVPIIAPGYGHAYPAGTIDSQYTYTAPPEDIRELNGEFDAARDLIHITTEPLKHGKGVEMLGAMNALPLWRRPKLLVQLQNGNGASTVPLGGAD